MSDRFMHAIIVSSQKEEDLRTAWDEAKEVFGSDPESAWDGGMVSNVVDGVANGYRSFFIGPDGSGLIHAAFQEAEEKRARYTAWLRRRRWSLGADALDLDWVQVMYGAAVELAGAGANIVVHSEEEPASEDNTSAGREDKGK